ncbi:MAG: hypothetical protein C0511_10685 [Hyphomicrobium sp.]|nr:hypothetical protein [Hyphomicrobium sp.]
MRHRELELIARMQWVVACGSQKNAGRPALRAAIGINRNVKNSETIEQAMKSVSSARPIISYGMQCKA